MAGLYSTLAPQGDYLKDVEPSQVGTGNKLAATELTDAESFADGMVDAWFSMYDRSAWSASTPPVINRIALYLGGYVCQGILNYRDGRAPDEGGHYAVNWLLKQAFDLKAMVDRAKCIGLGDGTVQRPKTGIGVIRITKSTPSYIVNNAQLYNLWKLVDNAWASYQAPLAPPYTWNN
jgi:hypothetical protein